MFLLLHLDLTTQGNVGSTHLAMLLISYLHLCFFIAAEMPKLLKAQKQESKAGARLLALDSFLCFIIDNAKHTCENADTMFCPLATLLIL